MTESYWQDRVVLVTGAARGIGRATAEHLGRHGACLALLDRRAEDVERAAAELGAQGIRCQPFIADQTDEAAVERAVSAIEAEFGSPHALFANAGLAVMRSFSDISTKEWRKVIDVNLTGTFLVVHRVVRSMIAHGIAGSIVLAGSVSGMHPTNRMAHYAAAKAGVIAFGKALARELGTYRIRVNVICPGVIRTEATEPFIAQPQMQSMLRQAIPLGSWGVPDDIALTVAFLLGPESSYINGAVLPVSGGNEAVEWWPLDYSNAGPPDWEKLQANPTSSDGASA
jgi:3-oxoacyl-[acyl-carrier protein] reductase